MRRKLTKTIILIVFVVFLGINEVNAETCTYRKSNFSDMYKIELDDEGKVTSIIYYEYDANTGGVRNAKNVTSSMTVDFKKCPSSVGVTGNTISAGGSAYQIYGNYGNEELPGGNDGYIGALDPGEDLNTVSCGEITGIPKGIPATTKIIYLLLQIGVPIVLVIFGMVDLMKAVTAQKEDEIKKGQQVLIKRVVSAVIIFFVFAIVKALASMLADSASVGECLNCFIKGECESNASADVEMEWK